MLKIQLEPSASDSLSGSPPAPPAWPGMLLFSVVIKLGDYLDSKHVPERIIFLLGGGKRATWKEGIIREVNCQPFPTGLSTGTALPGVHFLVIWAFLPPSQILTFFISFGPTALLEQRPR